MNGFLLSALLALAAVSADGAAAPRLPKAPVSAYGCWRSVRPDIPAAWCKCDSGCNEELPGGVGIDKCVVGTGQGGAGFCSRLQGSNCTVSDDQFPCTMPRPKGGLPSVTCPELFDAVKSSARCTDDTGAVHAEGSDVCTANKPSGDGHFWQRCVGGQLVNQSPKPGVCTTTTRTGKGTAACPHINKVQHLPTCYTQGCKEIAANINQYVDFSVDPCTDFYGMVCNRFLDENKSKLNQGYSGVSYFTFIQDSTRKIIDTELRKLGEDTNAKGPKALAGQAYKSCLDVSARNLQGVKIMTDAIDQFEVGTATLEQTLAILHQHLGAFSFFNFGVYVDGGKPYIYLFVDQDNYPYYQKVLDSNLKKLNDENAKSAYLTYVNTVTQRLTGKNDIDGKKIINYERELMNKIKAYEATLLPSTEGSGIWGDDHLPTPEEKARRWMDAGARPELVFADADNLRTWNWPLYFAGWGVKDVDTTADFKNTYLDPTARDLLLHILETTPTKDLAEYLRFTVAAGNTDLPLEFLYAETDVRKVYGLPAVGANAASCYTAIGDNLDMAVTRAYVDAAFPATSTQDLKAMIENIRAAFVDDIKTIEWLGEETKKAALKKLEYIVAFAGHPEGLRNDAWLANYYKNHPTDASNYVEFLHRLKALKSRTTTNIDTLRNGNTAAGRDVWNAGNPMTVNAYYMPSANTITMLQGILSFPFYDVRNQQSLNYGATGMVIGHEFTHGFDNGGKNYDEVGSRRNWWTANDTTAFNQRAQCFVEQYSQWDFPQHPVAGTKNNGKLTLPENIADNGGLRHAYNAYQKYVQAKGEEDRLPNITWNHQQLFFLGFGRTFCEILSPARAVRLQATDTHSPGEHRIWGTLQNFPAFAETFKCNAGTRYNPEKKCRIW